MSQDSSELHELMKRAEVEGPLMPREDRKRLEFLIQQLMLIVTDRYLALVVVVVLDAFIIWLLLKIGHRLWPAYRGGN